MRRVRRAGVVVALLSATGGCTGAAVQRGMDNYAMGDFPGAETQFAELESSIPDMNPKGYVRYASYRGLTNIALGRPALGCAWLRRGRSMFARGNSAWLPPNIVEQMKLSLSRCGDPVVPWP